MEAVKSNGHGVSAPLNHPTVEKQQVPNGQSVGQTLHLQFRLNKATPGAIQYREIVPDSQPPKMGTLYLKKYVVPQPYPELISVTVNIPLGTDLSTFTPIEP
jgi:hypothetical protein